MRIAAKNNAAGTIMVKCISILLIAALCLLDVPLVFAAFNSVSKKSFSASVTIGAGGDADYDGIPDAYDPNPSDPYDAHETTGDDGFTNLEKYVLSARGINIFDDTIGLALSAFGTGYLPLDVTFVATTTGQNIVKYEWDFDGNGTYDRWQYASKGNTVTYKYTASTTAKSYNARVRATDILGKIDTATTTVTVNKPASAPLAQVSGDLDGAWPVLNEFMIPTLQMLKGNGTASGSKEIVRYQWDTTGDGEYDISSTKSADASKTFNETISKMYTGTLKITDSQGLSDIAYFNVMANATSWDGSDYRPMVYLNNGVVYGTAAADVSLGGFGAPEGNVLNRNDESGYAKKLEWDFEGDGIYDWSSTVDNTNWTGYADVTRKYGAPGVYKATLKAHTEANVSSYKTAIVIIEGDEPAVRARAKVSQNGSGLITEITDGKIPVKAVFDHSASTGAVKYEWDFDGDKRIDYTTTDRNAVLSYDYTIPGYCVAMLRVIDSSGRIDVDYIPVFCTYPTAYGSVIKMPKEGQVIAGNAVTLAADVFPDNSGVNNVMFQYSSDGITWTNIGQGLPIMSYSRTWNTIGLAGAYQVRAIVNDVSSSDFKATTLIVNNSTSTPDVYENNNGKHTKKQVIDPNQSNTIVLPDGTYIEIPQGALLDGTGQKTINVEDIEISGVGAHNAIEITMGGINTFLKDITISIPYPDVDNNGIVDGTDIDENTLVVKWFNPGTGAWEVLYDSIVYPNENFISAKVNHLSIFGVFFGALAGGGLGSASSGGSTASYCFIATAAYGTPMADDVVMLRVFRDSHLMRTAAGREFVWNYYRYSPPVARFISDKPILRKIVRALLKPLVRVAKISSLRGRSPKQS